MSISEAILANLIGDTEGAERHVDKALLKAAVSQRMFCPGKSCGGVILDVRRAVLIHRKQDGEGACVTCGACYDAWRATLSPARQADVDALFHVADGRKLHARRPRKAAVRKAEMIRGTAVNSATQETREVALSEAEVARLLNDDEHDHCAGECACTVEPDGECSNFWPSRMRAIGMV